MGFVTVLRFWPVLWAGLRVTLLLSVIAIGGGTLIGLIVGLLLTNKSRLVRAPFRAYVNTFRGTPLLIQLFLIYLALPRFGIALAVLPAAALGFVLYTGAYVAEIVRSGIQAVPTGQTEAGYSLGLGYLQLMGRIILPQTRRHIVPALASFYLSLIKDTSLASIIGLGELITEGQAVIAATLKPFQVYVVIGVAYFCICFPISRLVSWLERRSRDRDTDREGVEAIRKRPRAQRGLV